MTGRVANALRKRCTPHTDIAPAQVAHAIGFARYTVDRWIQGASGPSAEAVGALDQFFRSHGDDRFLADCFAVPITPPAPAPVALDLWFLDGQAHPAPSGHAEFIRRRTGLSPHVTGDLRASACRNRGWVALEHSALGQVTIWHHTKVRSDAAKAARDWLILNADKVASAKRVVEIDGTFGEVVHDSAAQAANALARMLQPPRRRSPWHVERMPLAGMPAEFGKLLAVYQDDPAHVPTAALGLGLLSRCSILSVQGSSVMSHFKGDAINLPGEIINRNVLDRGDDEYGALVHAQVVGALAEPTFHRNRVAAYGRPIDYLTGKFHTGNGSVFSVVKLLEAA